MDPKTKTEAAALLYRAAARLKECGLDLRIDAIRSGVFDRDYNDYKVSQLLEAKADLLVAETRIESWLVDLGWNGVCEVEDSSIGGVPCIMPEVNDDLL